MDLRVLDQISANTKISSELTNNTKKSDEMSPLVKTRKTPNQEARKENINKKKVFIENIQYEVHENLLERFLSRYGRIKKAKIIRDSLTNKSKGFGYVEFFNEEDAVKMITNANPNDLMLKERQMIIRQFINKHKAPHHRKKTISQNKTDKTVELDSDMDTNGFNVNNLPIDVLPNILSQLSIRDLCIAEQVCKKWYNAARIVWSVRKKLILNDDTIFEKLEFKTKSQYGFVVKPKFDLKALKQILNKSSGSSLNHLDLSAIAMNFGSLCLAFIVNHCPNLTYLNISKANVSNQSFKHIRQLTKLKEINLSYCSKISDLSLSKLFKQCKQLESVDMTFCHTVVGKCFVNDGYNLKSIKMDQCGSIEDEFLVNLFSHNKNIEVLSMKRVEAYEPDTILFMLNNLKNLKILNLGEQGFDSLPNNANVNFTELKNLISLDIAGSKGSNELMAHLLKSSKSLKTLDVSYCSRLNDNLFFGLAINCPLVELNLNFIPNITDITLDSFTQLANTLQVLKLKGCSRLTSEAITKLMTQLTNLIVLDVRNNSNVNNTLLEAAVNLKNRKITIYCNDTSINTIEFEFKYPQTVRVLKEINYYEFKCDNLTFESDITKKISSGDGQNAWSRGFIYIGSPLTSGEEDSDFDFDNDHDDDDEFPERDDDLDFLEEEQEMINELDEY